MKIRLLFDLSTDALDLLDFFDRVDSTEQLVTRLDVLKRKGADELMSCIEGLRASVAGFLDDTVEASGALDDSDDESLDDVEKELAELGAETEILEPETSPSETKKEVEPQG
jgi:hypothetical protein